MILIWGLGRVSESLNIFNHSILKIKECFWETAQLLFLTLPITGEGDSKFLNAQDMQTVGIVNMIQ